MNCKVCSKLMDEYASRTLPDAMRAMMDGHVAECADCRAAVSQYQVVSTSLTGSLMNTTGSLRMEPDMEDRVLQSLGAAPAALPFEDMMKLFERLSFREKWAKVSYGLKQPKDTGAYKWAILQVKRLTSPAAAVLVPSLAMALMVVLAGMAPQRQQVVNVRIADDQHIPELEEPVDIPEPDLQPPDPQDIVEPMDNFIPSTSKTEAGPDVDFSPQPAQFDAVAIVRSPVTMRGVFGNRSPGARGSALGRFGGGGNTEGAALRALRWLKKYQEEDGHWHTDSGGVAPNPGGELYAGNPEAFTGLALLTFLGHGELPSSVEFGETVKGAIQFLLDNQRPDGTWNNREGDLGYTHAIVTFALCEAYAMTRDTSLLDPATRGIDFLISAQHTNGGWNYLTRNPAQRQDVSVTAWAVQALKAASLAGIGSTSRVDASLQKAVESYKNVFFMASQGVFRYDTRRDSLGLGAGTLTSAAVLALQLAGASEIPECQAGLKWLVANATCDWENPWGRSPIYYWYYTTQAMFHAGGEIWREWNSKFSVELVKNQTIIPNAIMGPNGRMKDIGYWKPLELPARRAEYCQAYVYNTTLNALQLMVYYRYLPTFQKPEDIIADGGERPERAPRIVEAQDLEIELQL